MDKNDILLRVKNISKRFYKGGRVTEALHNVSFDIKRGEVLGIVGESGSGKTTAGRAIVGIYELDGGDIYFRGERIRAGVPFREEAIKVANARGRVKLFAIKAGKNGLPKDKVAACGEVDNVNKELQTELRELSAELSRAKIVARGSRRRVYTGIQMIFQDPGASLNPCMTVGENIAEGLVVRGVKSDEIKRRVDEVLLSVGLSSVIKDRYPHEFSGGQRQRIGIARAIIMKPELLIADEPVSALDVSVGAQVINLISELSRRLCISVLFIAHDLSVVRHISDRVGVMYRGRLVELAPTEELYKNPIHPYTRSLLSAMPRPDPGYVPNLLKYNEDSAGESGEFREVSVGHFVLL